jgi:hypothetical protein
MPTFDAEAVADVSGARAREASNPSWKRRVVAGDESMDDHAGGCPDERRQAHDSRR